MKRNLLLVLISALLLASCTLYRATPTVSQDAVDTEVARLQTQNANTNNPTQPSGVTSIPTTAPSSTILPTVTVGPSATQEPTTTQVPTESPTNTSSPEPSAMALLTSTPSAADPKTILGSPTFQDQFKTQDNWQPGEDKFTRLEMTGQGLVLTGLSRSDGWKITWPDIKDFYLEASITTGTCSGTDRYGIIFRIPDLSNADRGYLAGLTCDGKYSLRQWDTKKMNVLIPWTNSPFVQAGAHQTNRIGILAASNHLTVYINGQKMQSVDDAAYSHGGFGVFVGANTTDNFTITVSDISYWENPNL